MSHLLHPQASRATLLVTHKHTLTHAQEVTQKKIDPSTSLQVTKHSLSLSAFDCMSV